MKSGSINFDKGMVKLSFEYKNKDNIFITVYIWIKVLHLNTFAFRASNRDLVYNDYTVSQNALNPSEF